MPTAAVMAVGAIAASRSASKARKKAQQSAERGQDLAVSETRAGSAQARKDAIPLFQSAQQNALQGFQGALDVFGQTIPQQFQAFQGGNVGAQNALLSGLSQQQAAILGQQLNPNALQAQTLDLPDFSAFQQQLPDFTSIDQALGINQMGPIQNPNRFAPGAFGGRFRRGGQFRRRQALAPDSIIAQQPQF